MPRPLLLAAVFFLLMLCACPDERRSSFEQERQSVQKALSGAGELARTHEVKQNGNMIESSWDFEFAGDKVAAVKSLNASKPDGYTSIRQGDSEVVFAKFDGHDSFQVIATFSTPDPAGRMLAVSVVLKSYPD
jgi:hypothetical protein